MTLLKELPFKQYTFKHVKNMLNILNGLDDLEKQIIVEKFNKLVNNAKVNMMFNKNDIDHVLKSQLIESAKDLKNYLRPVLLMIDKAI